jgi:hypothetical protein
MGGRESRVIIFKLPGTRTVRRWETNMESAIPNLHKIADVLVFDSAQYFPRLGKLFEY